MIQAGPENRGLLKEEEGSQARATEMAAGGAQRRALASKGQEGPQAKGWGVSRRPKDKGKVAEKVRGKRTRTHVGTCVQAQQACADSMHTACTRNTHIQHPVPMCTPPTHVHACANAHT